MPGSRSRCSVFNRELFLVIFGYFWLFLVTLVIFVCAIRLTSCFDHR